MLVAVVFAAVVIGLLLEHNRLEAKRVRRELTEASKNRG